MGWIAKLRRLSSVMSNRSQDGPLETVTLQRKRPGLLLGTAVFEFGQVVSGRVDDRLKALAQIKTSALVGCPF